MRFSFRHFTDGHASHPNCVNFRLRRAFDGNRRLALTAHKLSKTSCGRIGIISARCSRNFCLYPESTRRLFSPLSVDAASATKIVRPGESTAETQPKFQPAFLTLSAMISQFFTRLQRVEPFRGSAARMDEDGNRGNKKHRRKNCAAVAIDFLCRARPTTGLQNCRY